MFWPETSQHLTLFPSLQVTLYNQKKQAPQPQADCMPCSSSSIQNRITQSCLVLDYRCCCYLRNVLRNKPPMYP